MKAALEEAIDEGLLDRNPARKIVRPQTRATCKRFLSIEEITSLLDEMDARDRPGGRRSAGPETLRAGRGEANRNGPIDRPPRETNGLAPGIPSASLF